MTDPMGSVLVQVLGDDGRQISWGSRLGERLQDRLPDIRQAIEGAAAALAESVSALPAAEGWDVGQVSASFGITLTADAGVLVSKASAGATFEVVITCTRTPQAPQEQQ